VRVSRGGAESTELSGNDLAVSGAAVWTLVVNPARSIASRSDRGEK
jgi:hypothetical protein